MESTDDGLSHHQQDQSGEQVNTPTSEESRDHSDEASTSTSLGPEWVDILENGQLLKKVLIPGDTSSNRPQRGHRVTVSLKTRIKETGADVPSETFEKADVFLGDYEIIHGVDLALALMNVGEVSLVIIHPRFGYGQEGKAPDVPSNASLECEVHLHSSAIVDEESSLPFEDRLSVGLRKKNRGNFWFERKDYNSAIHCYNRAIVFLDANEEEMSNEMVHSMIDSRAVALNNLANAQMITDALDQALKSVNSSLELRPNNVKGWYRKGKILSMRGELVEAIESLRMALKIEPESRVIQNLLNEVAKRRKQELVEEKRLYQRMLQVDPSFPSDYSKSKRGQSQDKYHGQPSYLSKLLHKVGLIGGCSLIVIVIGISAYYFL